MLKFEGLGPLVFSRLARSVRKSCDLAGKCCFLLMTHIFVGVPLLGSNERKYNQLLSEGVSKQFEDLILKSSTYCFSKCLQIV